MSATTSVAAVPAVERRYRRLVALDVDGTIMGADGTMSRAVVDAIRAVCDAGDHVVLATGRSVISAAPIARRLGLGTGPAVCSNGAVTVALDPAAEQGFTIVDMVTFNPGPTLRAIHKELPDAVYGVEDVGRGFFLTKPFPPGEIMGVHTQVDFDHLCGLSATRAIVRSLEHTEDDFQAVVERVGLLDATAMVGCLAWLDLNPKGVSKASALEAVRRRLGVPLHATVAIGDGRNDADMLGWAGRGVAMGSAPDEVKAAADEVTGTVGADGVVPVLMGLLD